MLRPAAARGCRDLVPVPRGCAYRIGSPPHFALVTRDLAAELQRVLDRFAREAGFDERHPVAVSFRPGIFGHHRVGRAADLYRVGGVGMEEWKRRWDEARSSQPPGGPDRRGEWRRNLGWRLYRALHRHGRWSQPSGYPVQLFGPWTREEGPWRRISDRLLRAHRDHIHVAL